MLGLEISTLTVTGTAPENFDRTNLESLEAALARKNLKMEMNQSRQQISFIVRNGGKGVPTSEVTPFMKSVRAQGIEATSGRLGPDDIPLLEGMTRLTVQTSEYENRPLSIHLLLSDIAAISRDIHNIEINQDPSTREISITLDIHKLSSRNRERLIEALRKHVPVPLNLWKEHVIAGDQSTSSSNRIQIVPT